MAEILINTGIVPAFRVEESLIPPADSIPRPPERLFTFEDVAQAVPTRGRSRFNYFSPYGGMSPRRHSHIGIDPETWANLRKVKGDRGRDERTMLGYFQTRFNKANGIDHRERINNAITITEGLEEEPLPSPDVIKKSPFAPLLGLLMQLQDRRVDESLQSPVPSENGHKPKQGHFDDPLPTFTSEQLVGLTTFRIKLRAQELNALPKKERSRPFARKIRAGRNGTSPVEEVKEVVTSGDDPMSWIAEDRSRFAERTRLEKMISRKVKDHGTGRRFARITNMVKQDRMRTTQGRTFEQKQAQMERKMAEAKITPQQEKVA